MKPSAFQFFLLGIFSLLGGMWCEEICAKEYRNGFDDKQVSWKLKYDQTKVKPLSHRRSETLLVRGRASEVMQVQVQQRGTYVEMIHTLPPARVIDDLKLTLWFRSNRGRAQLYLRAVFPHQKDRRTGAVLSTWLKGSTYKKTGSWEQLECTTSQEVMKNQIRLLRSKLNDRHLDFRDAFVDRVVIAAEEDKGAIEYLIDELQFGPIVDAKAKQKIARTNSETEDSETSNRSLSELRLGRFLVKDRPFFPLITPYHNEDEASLKQSGMNLIWVRDYRNRQLLAGLRKQGMYAMAAPPRAVSKQGKVLQASHAGIPAIGDETSDILVWMMGQRVSSQSKQEVKSLTEQLHQADKNYSRPIMIDVVGDERFYSQYVSMLGMSRHVNNTTLSYKDYRDWLVTRKRLARPGSFAWTWIQTEPDTKQARHRYLTGRKQIVVEPEQIRLQVYSALSAGCRGLGYWKTFSLDGKAAGATERKLAINQLNKEISLVEDWLATGNVIAQVPFQVGGNDLETSRKNQTGRSQIGFRNASHERRERNAILRERQYQAGRQSRRKSELEATIIRGDSGLLLLPVWYGKDAQFCPGKMTANNVSIIVPGVDEAAIPWEVTTTSVRSLPRERVTGGIRITLKKFDLTAMIVLTNDQQLIARLKSRVAKMAKESAQIAIDLAQEKYLRVKQVDLDLQQQGVGQVDASQLLRQARGLLKRAEFYYSRNDFNSARLLAADTMQSLRILQRACWNDAVRSLSSPVSSPHTISFQTLPDHWRMVSRLGRSEMKNENNLLHSGDFEDIDTMTVEKWRHAQNPIDGIDATAELYPQAQKGKYSLRLIAVPKTGEPIRKVLEQTPVLVSTPPMKVRSGQIVHISGWVKVVSRTVNGSDGLMIYDSIAGTQGAIRWKKQDRWKRFQLIREASQSGTFTITMALTGLGEVQIDQLQVVPHNPRTLADANTTKPKTSSLLNPRDLWNRLPSIPRPEFPELPEMPAIPRPEMPDFRNIRTPQMPNLRDLNPLAPKDDKTGK